MQQSQEPRAVSAQQQQELKQTLREAFAGNDGVNCWAWVIFDHEVTVSATNEAASARGELNADEVQLLAREGNYVRLIQHVGPNYLFAKGQGASQPEELTGGVAQVSVGPAEHRVGAVATRGPV